MLWRLGSQASGRAKGREVFEGGRAEARVFDSGGSPYASTPLSKRFSVPPGFRGGEYSPGAPPKGSRRGHIVDGSETGRGSQSGCSGSRSGRRGSRRCSAGLMVGALTRFRFLSIDESSRADSCHAGVEQHFDDHPHLASVLQNDAFQFWLSCEGGSVGAIARGGELHARAGSARRRRHISEPQGRTSWPSR